MSETEPAAPAAPPSTPRVRRLALLALVAAAVALVLVALSWLDARSRIGATQDELARRLRDIESDAREARPLARQGQEASREAQGKIGQREPRVGHPQS